MDGTLIDSEPYWIAAETELAARFGVVWTHEDGLGLVGNPLTVSAQVLRDRGVDMEIDDIIGFLLMRVSDDVRGHVPWQEDARRLLEAAVAAGIPCALVTMSYTRMADAFLAAVPEAFSVVVTGDRVSRGKPDPEAYLTAARELGVDIADCVAIEDSPSGVGSAWSAGARTVGVRRIVPLEPRAGLSRVRGLDGWTVETLARVVGGEVIDELGEER